MPAAFAQKIRAAQASHLILFRGNSNYARMFVLYPENIMLPWSFM
jgi:hypothetical protein